MNARESPYKEDKRYGYTMSGINSLGVSTRSRKDWYEQSVFNIHLDHHATPERSPHLGAGLKETVLRRLLRKVKPDMVQYHAAGHPGWLLFESKMGLTCPTLEKDFLKIWAKVCREEGIQFGFYYSSGINEQVSKIHPEWARVNYDGTHCEESHGVPLCFNSPYVEEYMIPLFLELIDKYNPSHFWLDGDIWSVMPCWCQWCRQKFKAKYHQEMPEDEKDPAAIKFQYDSFVDYLGRVKVAMAAKKPSIKLCGNWAFTFEHGAFMNPCTDWISGDLITNISGLRQASLETAYISILDKPFDMMTWDKCMPQFLVSQALPKSEGYLKAEAAIILSHGGRVFIWNNPLPDCSLYEYQWDVLGKVGKFVRELAPFCIGNKSIAETGILYASKTRYLRANLYEHARKCVYACHKVLFECFIPMDIFSEQNLKSLLKRYKLIILPESPVLEKSTVTALRKYVREGGTLLIIGYPEIYGKNRDEHLSDLTGACFHSKKEARFFLPVASAVFEFKGMLAELEVTTAKVIKEFAQGLNSPNGSGVAALLKNTYGNGKVFTVPFNLLAVYHDECYIKYRDFLIEVLDRAYGQEGRQVILRTENPVEAVLNTNGTSIFIHLTNHNVGRITDERNHYLEDMCASTIEEVRLRINKRPSGISLIPKLKQIDFSYSKGYICIKNIPSFKYYVGIKIDF